MGSMQQQYSSRDESTRIVDLLCSLFDPIGLPTEARALAKNVVFTAERDQPIFPIPFKETETTAALKAIEGSVASLLAATRETSDSNRQVTVSLEKTTAFLFQAYLATVGGLGKLDKSVRSLLKGKHANQAANSHVEEATLMILEDTDLLQAQSDPYRRMSANLYKTATPGEYYHIHGSLEASTTLGFLGLEPFRPDLETHEQIVEAIETAVEKYTPEQLEALNAQHRQAGVQALKHEQFLKTQHVSRIIPHSHNMP